MSADLPSPSGARRIVAPIARILSVTALWATSSMVTGATMSGVARAAADSGAAVAHGTRGGHDHVAAKGASKAPRPVAFECADALDDGTLVDDRQADAIARLAGGTRWPVAEPPPAVARPRGVRLYCGPDLDGDGDREALAEVTYLTAADGDSPSGGEADVTPIDGAPASYWFLVSKHGLTWRAIAGLAVELGGAPEDVGRSAIFVRRPAGKWGVEVERRGGPAQAGCHLAGYEIFELHAGVLRSVKAGDRSTACVPCGCDAP
jgi:hypothetical protein